MSERNEGLTLDPLFVAATRPPTRWGVPYLAILANMVVTMEIFLCVKNPLVLLMALPIHGLCMLLCTRDPRIFELLALWAQTRVPGLAGNLLVWQGNTHSALTVNLPDLKGARRRAPPTYV